MKRLIVIFILLISFGTNAQRIDSIGVDLIKGEPFNTTRKENFNGFIGANKSLVYTIDYLQINRKKQELNLRRFDKKDLTLVETTNIFSVIDERFYNEPTEIFFQHDSIYLFSTLNGLKDKFNLVYLEIFDQYGGKISGRVVDTLTLDDEFVIQESEEKEGFLVAHHNKYDNLFEQKIHLEAIDRTGMTIWENTLESPSSLQNLEMIEIAYSIHHPVFILCDYGFDVGIGGREEGDLINNNYIVWGYDHELKFLKEFDLQLKNKWINGIHMAFNTDNQLIIGGFINETRNYSINGVFSLKLNHDLEVVRTDYYKYRRSFYSKFVEPKRLDKTKELDDIVLRDLVVLEDGSYFLLGEHYYMYTERNYDPRTNITTTTENYNYNSIVIAYFDKNGSHQWSERIPKFQHSINDGGYFSSFSTTRLDDEIYLFFNDSDKNNEIATNDYFNYKSLYNNRKFQITFVNVNRDGVTERGHVVNASNSYMIRAKQSYQVEKDIMYLSGEVGKTRRLFGMQF